MNRALVVAIALVSGTVGFFLGRSMPAQTRAEARALAPREQPAETPPPEAEHAIRAAEERASDADAEVREEGGEEPPTAVPEVPGTRRPDGTIVGGATWTPMTSRLAIGYLEGQMNAFFADANLTEYQKQKLREEMTQRITDLMQLAADHANGDINGEQVYNRIEDLAATTRANVGQILDERQRKKMDDFERGMVEFNRDNIISNEMTTLRQELNLDAEQERLIRPIVEERYRRVQERVTTPIPNFMFKPIRRDSDGDIYSETGKAMRQYLRPEQREAYEAAEVTMATAIFQYRPGLVPKPPSD